MIRSCRGRIASVAAAVLVISMSACYEPAFEPCAVACGEGDTCPGDMACVGGLCAPAGESCIDTSEPLLRTIAGGGAHTCAIVDGAILCWGDNAFSQLAQPATTTGGDPTEVTPPVTGPGQWISVAAGARHTCALFRPVDAEAPGEVWCWGHNTNSQCGVPDGNGFARPEIDGVDWIAIGAGATHSCGIGRRFVDDASQVYCWGDNAYGQLDGTVGDPDPVGRVVALPGVRWRGVDGGDAHTCAVSMDGDALCWGLNTSSQHGTGDPATRTPQQVPGQWAMIAAGGYHTCGVRVVGSVACWGENADGQLGTGSTDEIVTEPTGVMGEGTSSGWSLLDTTWTTTCGIAGGDAYCWGEEAVPQGAGRLGTAQLAPMSPVQGLAAAPTDIAASRIASCAQAGGVMCWGDSPEGQLGDGTRTVGYAVTEIASPEAGLLWQSVVAGANHTCAVATGTSGDVTYCWGLNDHGQAGVTAVQEISAAPTAMELRGDEPRTVAVGAHHTCGVKAVGVDDATVTCWGDDSRGQDLGDAGSETIGFTADPSITAGGDYTCLLGSSERKPMCWGTPDDDGHDSTTAVELSPNVDLIEGTMTWSETSGCAIENTVARNVYCIGTERLGELGNDTNEPAPWPMAGAVVGLTTATSILGGGPGRTRCAGLATGEIRCWGDNGFAQVTPETGPLGTVERPQFTTNIGAGIPISLATGGRHACAINSARNLSCWGGFDNGQRAGPPAGFAPETIDQPAGVDDWTMVSAGSLHTCAIGSITTPASTKLFCWGRNTYGQVGAGDNTARAVAAPIMLP